MDKKPLACPRCGKLTAPAAGLYRCTTCGGFNQRIDGHGNRSDRYDSNGVGLPPIDGRPTPLDKRIR